MALLQNLNLHAYSAHGSVAKPAVLESLEHTVVLQNMMSSDGARCLWHERIEMRPRVDRT